MAMESSSLPVPSEVVLPLAGYLVYTGHFNFVFVVIAATAGNLVGTLIDYSIGFYLGRAAILRYGRYVRLSESHLKTAETWFAKHGNITVLFAQFVPLIRTLVAFPAGIAEMKVWKFISFAVIGIVIWDTALTYLGYAFGQNYTTISAVLEKAFTPIGIIAVILAILGIAIYARRRSTAKKKEQQQQGKLGESEASPP
jgi:membrane protein DedA with SNARE-associated domain